MYSLRLWGGKITKWAGDFSVDNILLRKLYSVEIDGEAYKERSSGTIGEELFLKNFLHLRTSFYYNYKMFIRRYCRKACCCCWCCYGRKDTEADKIFDKASTRLYNELDVVNIVR